MVVFTIVPALSFSFKAKDYKIYKHQHFALTVIHIPHENYVSNQNKNNYTPVKYFKTGRKITITYTHNL